MAYGNAVRVDAASGGGIGSYTTSGPSALTEKRDTIQSAQDRQDAANAELHNIIGTLEDRLSVAMEPQPPTTQTPTPPEPQTSNLAARGQKAANVTEYALTRLNSIIHRLQL